ncbi:hypothetical protein BDN70DRAFT_279938 [Pholiota conissans]|uniref:Uncharacterized protein n=1 Tax=Pholiota conissans TaxID=109636 RepID=A0A9P6D5J2_9AGAR|nr:hypothetical protein BDN70DRAFT_279938 [Pholiota conissans]
MFSGTLSLLDMFGSSSFALGSSITSSKVRGSVLQNERFGNNPEYRLHLDLFRVYFDPRWTNLKYQALSLRKVLLLESSCKFRPQKLIKLLVQAVGGMKNVTQFNFEWRDLPVNKLTSLFLTSARSAFDSSLRKLILRAQIPYFKEVLAITNFDNITKLEVQFDYQPQFQTQVM